MSKHSAEELQAVSIKYITKTKKEAFSKHQVRGIETAAVNGLIKFAQDGKQKTGKELATSNEQERNHMLRSCS